MHQLICTHLPVTVCCVVVCGSPRAEGLTVAPAGRDVVDIVSFLADSEHKRCDVSSTSSARCGHYLSTLPHQTPGVVACTAGPHHTQHSCHYQHMHVIHQHASTHMHTKWSSHQLTTSWCFETTTQHCTAQDRTGQDRMGLVGMLHTHNSPRTAGRESPSCGVDGSPSGVTSATAVGEGTFGVLYAMSTMTSLIGWDQQQ